MITKNESLRFKKIIIAACMCGSFFLNYIPAFAGTVLNIPYHHQAHSLSCEIAALQMALNEKNIYITESTLLKFLPFSDRGSRHLGNIWGDPEIGFVGNIDGSMPNSGYGVYEQPIKNLAEIFRRAMIMNDASLDDLLTELDHGNPILVWGNVSTGKDISWHTPQGKYIHAIIGEHVRVMSGYTGTHENPTSIILMDPLY